MRLAPMGLCLAAGAACMGPRPGPVGPPPMVFIHGIKGSTLVDPAGRMRWLGALGVLALRRDDLALPLAWSAEGQSRDALRPGAPLRDVTVIPRLAQEEVYGPWLDAAAAMPHPLYSFAYDWRRDNLETLDAFAAFIADVRGRHAGQPVRIVAHSMGGLITLAYLNAHPEAVHDVVFAGVPFDGGIGFLLDMHVGVPVGLNAALMGPEVLATYPSVYSLFPLDGHGLVDSRGAPVAMDFFSPEAWEDAGLGVFAPGRPRAVAAASRAELRVFLQHALPRARAFRSLLVAREQPYPPILVVTSRHTPTLMRVMRGGPRAILGWDFVSAPREPGDGRVSYPASLPPQPIPHQVLLSDRTHADLLSDPNVIAAIAALPSP